MSGPLIPKIERFTLFSIVLLYSLLFFGVYRLIGLHCFSFYDLGIYSEALNRIRWGDLNPFIPGRDIHIFNDHFDPILVPFSFLTRFFHAPYLGVTLESLAILLSWYPLRLLRDRGYFTYRQALFGYAFLILNQATIAAVTWPFHPTTWGFLPLVYFYAFYVLEEWTSLWIAFFFLCLCREEFPLIGFSLAAVFFFDKKWKPAISFLFTAIVWNVFLFWLRPKLFGETMHYGGNLLGSFFAHPFDPFVALFKRASIQNGLERFAALLMVLSWASIKDKWVPILKTLVVASPILGIRYAASKWGFHYGTAAVISIFFALSFALKTAEIKPWRRVVSVLALVIFFLSPVLKNLWDGFTEGQTHFAYKTCPNRADRLASIEKAQAWLASSSHQKILFENNLSPTFLLKATDRSIFILAGEETAGKGPYEAVLVEKPPLGDRWGVSPERLLELIQTWKNIPGVHVVQDDEFVFLAEGAINPDH